jgi:hypothetical protein
VRRFFEANGTANLLMDYCDGIGADTYINPIGGTGLYSKRDFSLQGIYLQLIKSRDYIYIHSLVINSFRGFLLLMC